MVNGRSRRVTRALARMAPRGLEIVTQSRFAIFLSAASSGTELDEQLRLQLGEPRVPAAHRPGQVVLGQPVGGHDVGELRIANRGERIGVVLPVLHHRAGLLIIERVLDRRLRGLVVRGEWPIHETTRDEQPAKAIRSHDERRGAGKRIHAWGLPASPCRRAVWWPENRGRHSRSTSSAPRPTTPTSSSRSTGSR
jgi:hypothetical protein